MFFSALDERLIKNLPRPARKVGEKPERRRQNEGVFSLKKARSIARLKTLRRDRADAHIVRCQIIRRTPGDRKRFDRRPRRS